MNTITVVGSIFAVIAVMITIISIFANSVDKKIEQMINDPDFIKKVASEVRLPFTIVDEKSIIQYDSGALDYIDKIEVNLDEKDEIKDIIVTPKQYMSIAPLIECINSNFQFAEPEKIPPYGWKYSEAKTGFDYFVTKSSEEGKPLIRKLELQLLSNYLGVSLYE